MRGHKGSRRCRATDSVQRLLSVRHLLLPAIRCDGRSGGDAATPPFDERSYLGAF